jgi:hypothetical protein
LERDLHDSVHTELVSLILRLKLAEEDELTPSALACELAALGDHACAVLDALREITHGFQPIALSRHGVAAALKARAQRSPIPVTISGTVPRSTDESEEAVYFACSEAIQNTIKHAGRTAQLTLSLRHEHRTLTVKAQDDGCGFDPAHPTPAPDFATSPTASRRAAATSSSITGWHFVLPLFGLITGGLTDYIALTMIFRPKQERRIAPGIRWQGLFHSRRAQVTRDYAARLAKDVITPAAILDSLLTGPMSDKLVLRDDQGRDPEDHRRADGRRQTPDHPLGRLARTHRTGKVGRRTGDRKDARGLLPGAGLRGRAPRR